MIAASRGGLEIAADHQAVHLLRLQCVRRPLARQPGTIGTTSASGGASPTRCKNRRSERSRVTMSFDEATLRRRHSRKTYCVTSSPFMATS